jgi:hypothetical protein
MSLHIDKNQFKLTHIHSYELQPNNVDIFWTTSHGPIFKIIIIFIFFDNNKIELRSFEIQLPKSIPLQVNQSNRQLIHDW